MAVANKNGRIFCGIFNFRLALPASCFGVRMLIVDFDVDVDVGMLIVDVEDEGEFPRFFSK